MNAARGILLGVLLGLVLWTSAIIGALLAVRWLT